MKLSELLHGVSYTSLSLCNNMEINKVQYDSRQVKKGDLFICISGFNVDGHVYIKTALERGAAAIVVQKEVEDLDNINVITVKDTRKALALISSNYFHNPSKELKIIGITGTNGKTTSSYMIKSILEKAGFKVGLVGTIANYIGNKRIVTHRTTPESLELHELFRQMVDSDIDYCVMEVSSHSLALNRVYGIEFTTGIFTNLTRDHLDFHKTFERYYESKLKLFKNSRFVVVNVDDEYGKKIIKDIKEQIFTYSMNETSDLIAVDIKMHSRGVDFFIEGSKDKIKVELKIPGRYNVYNALCAASSCVLEGIDFEIIKAGLEDVLVPGRCEIVTQNYNIGYEVIVDYAHTPDGLENILKTVREFTDGRLITVFGCGGDRDKTKRPIMGRIAAEISDFIIITSDNPRSEEPNSIIDDILLGVKKDNYVVIENRRDAIKNAMDIAKPGDIIVVAGKGHEDYQEIKGKIIHFDEREIIKEIIEG